MWVFKFDGDRIYIGYYRHDGRFYYPLTLGSDELYDAIRIVNYLNGGSGDKIDMKIDQE